MWVEGKLEAEYKIGNDVYTFSSVEVLSADVASRDYSMVRMQKILLGED